MRERQFLARSLRELQAEQRRLLVLQDRLRIQAETLALRHEIASARRSAAQARYDAGESMLDLQDAGSGYDLLLADAEERALEAEAQADALEQMLAAWQVDEEW